MWCYCYCLAANNMKPRIRTQLVYSKYIRFYAFIHIWQTKLLHFLSERNRYYVNYGKES